MSKSKYSPYKKIICDGELSSQKIAELIGDGCTAGAVRNAKHRFLKFDQYKATNKAWRTQNYIHENRESRGIRASTREDAYSNGTAWTIVEDTFILSSPLTTQQQASEIGRTMDAIYKRRAFLNRQKNCH